MLVQKVSNILLKSVNILCTGNKNVVLVFISFSDDVEVPLILCKHQQGSYFDWFPSSELKRDCHRACTGECHLTEWSKWSDCYVWCTPDGGVMDGVKSGIQTRSRVGFIIGQVFILFFKLYRNPTFCKCKTEDNFVAPLMCFTTIGKTLT